MDIFTLIKDASEEWAELLEGNIPALMVGNATCGRSAGANIVIEKLISEIHNKKLDFKILEVGCIGMCYMEPIVSVYKPGYPILLYGNVNEKHAQKLINALQNGGDIVIDNLIGVIGNNQKTDLPNFFDTPVMKPRCPWRPGTRP